MQQVLLTGLYSACVLVEPRTPSSRVATPTVNTALVPQSLIKKLSYKLAYGLILMEEIRQLRFSLLR